MGHAYTYLVYIFLVLCCPTLLMAADNERLVEQSAPAQDPTERLVVCVPVDNPPFAFLNEKNELVGFNLDIFAHFDVQQDTHMEIVTFETGLARVQSGTCHMFLANVTRTEEREDTMIFSRVYMRSGTHALVFKESPITTNDDLVYSIVGALKGSLAEQFAFHNLTSSIIYALRDYTVLTQMLLEGDIEALLGSKPILQTIRDAHTQLHIIEPPLLVEEYAYAFAPGQEHLRDNMDTVLARLQENNSLDALFRQWFPNTPQPTP